MFIERVVRRSESGFYNRRELIKNFSDFYFSTGCKKSFDRFVGIEGKYFNFRS